MAYVAISGSVPQFQRNAGGAAANGYYLKGYEAGTTTPLSMGADSTPTSTLAKCALNTRGEPISNDADETTVFIPHFDESYKLVLYTNSTDADANTTANALWVVDNISGAFDSSQINYRSGATVEQKINNLDAASYTELKAITVSQLANNDSINVRYRALEDDGGGGIFHWDSSDNSANVTADPGEGIYVPPNSDATGASGCWVRQYNSKPKLSFWGVAPSSDRDSPQTTAIQRAFDFVDQIEIDLVGQYVIDDTLTKDAHSFKLFGVGEGDNGVKFVPANTWVGSTQDSDGNEIMLSLGNGSSSRYFNEIRNVTFLDPDESGNYTALYFDRVNNMSKIFNCEFEKLARGFELINLSLANTVCFNKFFDCDDHFRLTGNAGNSTQITHNYFASGGRSYLNDSMTGVQFSHNQTDGEYYLYTDGSSGLRGCQFMMNRFESSGATGNPAMDFGVVRGAKVAYNYYQGQGSREIAIRFRSSGAIESASVIENHFELYADHYVDSNLPDGGLNLHGNTSTTNQDENEITGVTQANPAVVTYTGNDNISDGDIISINFVRGMTELNGNTYTVANLDAGANTFELSGIDSTSYGTYVSGGMLFYPAIKYDTNRLAYGYGEENIWIPEVRDASGNVGSIGTYEGIYQRNTNWVTISAQLTDIDTTGLTAGDQLRVYGIPWDISSSSGDPSFFAGHVRCNNVGFTSQIVALGGESDSYIVFADLITGAGDDDIIVSDLTSGSADIFFTITYKIKA